MILRRKKEVYLKFVSSAGCCNKCAENDKKIFRKSDETKPALPIHPNCKCRYEEVIDTKEINIGSQIVRVDDSPGIGGIRVSGIDDMLNKLERKYQRESLKELIISNHGGNEGSFPMGNNDVLNRMSSTQLARLKKLLKKDATIDIRMCYTAGDKEGNEAAQKLANALGVKVRGYEGPVSPYGTRPGFVKPDADRKNNYFQRILPNHRPKIFYPEK